MLTGKGTPDMEVENYGGVIAEAERSNKDHAPKDVEDFTDSEYERFLKDGTLRREQHADPKADAEPKPQSKEQTDPTKPAPLRDSHHFEPGERKKVFDTIGRLQADGTITPQLDSFMATVLKDPGLQNPYAILKHVAENPQVLKDIHRLAMAGDGAKINAMIYKLDMQYDGSRKKQVTGAKKPPAIVGGQAAAGKTEEEEENAVLRKAGAGDEAATTRYIEMANARDIRKRRATIGGGRR